MAAGGKDDRAAIDDLFTRLEIVRLCDPMTVRFSIAQ